MERRVVITGESSITPIGRERETLLVSLREGVSGVKPLRPDGLLTQNLQCQVFGTVDYPIEYDFSRRYRKTMGPVSYYACQVSKEAIERAGLDKALLSSGRTGVAFSSTHGSPTVQRGIYEVFFSGSQEGFGRIQATEYLKSMVHTTAVNITKMFKITGRVIASSTACTTSSQSIGFGFESIRYGLQDVMICGGADEYDTTTVAVFDGLLACSHAYNDRPAETPRPFDQDRDGLVVGEGAGAVVLEELEHAKARGAPILAEVIGFACGSNGGDLILPNKDGVRQTIEMGLQNAHLAPADVDLISAHATGTRMGDIVESRAMAEVYGEGPRVTALKSYMGHTMGTCGVIETILCTYMMQEGEVIPIRNLVQVDERCAPLRFVTEREPAALRTVSVQNFAFGGVNTALFLRRYDA